MKSAHLTHIPYILACHLQIDAVPDPDLASHFHEDPDPGYHFDADPDPTLQFDAEPDTQPVLRIRIRDPGLGAF